MLFESQSPPAGAGGGRVMQDAANLAAAGHRVIVVLVQNGVLGALSGGCAAARAAGAVVWADPVSLAERGMEPAWTEAAGVLTRGLEAAAAWLVRPGVKAVWH
ncbi:MAG: hypothetical protein LBH76_07305 [Propionibacteriaceae bacterium]|nr:hypothetical protein [Propionibacteriaceae bacterium]